MYLTYEDYIIYGGTLEEAAFNDIEFEAESIIDWYTFNRLRNTEYAQLDSNVKRCVISIIKLLLEQKSLNPTSGENNDVSRNIASQSNDGVSISYNVLSAKDSYDISSQQMESTIRRYLSFVTDSKGRRVLYRGVYPNE